MNRFIARWLLFALALVALVLYFATLAPGVLPADSGEFQLVAATLGIAHPPGYPLYTVLGWLFTRLTPADPAWGLNLLSALIAVLTLVVVAVAAENAVALSSRSRGFSRSSLSYDSSENDKPSGHPKEKLPTAAAFRPSSMPKSSLLSQQFPGLNARAGNDLEQREEPNPLTPFPAREGGSLDTPPFVGEGTDLTPRPPLPSDMEGSLQGKGESERFAPPPLVGEGTGERSSLYGFPAALALMGATTFWAAATTANIRIFVALFAALVLWLALRAIHAPTPRRLAALALVSGLAVSHHGSLAFTVLPAWLAVGWAWFCVVRTLPSAVTESAEPPPVTMSAEPPPVTLSTEPSPVILSTEPPPVTLSAAKGLTSRWARLFAALRVTEWGLPQLLLVVLCGLLGLTPWLYLLVRGAPGTPPHPGSLSTVTAWLDHILARGFGGDMFAFARLDILPDRLLILIDILRFQFGWPWLILAALGIVACLSPRNPLFQNKQAVQGPTAFLLLVAFALPAFVAITYRAPQTVEYLMPAYVGLVLWMGAGVATLGEWLSALGERVAGKSASARPLFVVLYSLVLLVGASNIYALWPSYIHLSQDNGTQQTAEVLLRAATPNGTILAGWHQATPLWYLQYVAGVRPDVTVEYVVPAGAEQYPATWRRLLESATQRGPTLATNRYTTYHGAPFTISPLGAGFLALRGDPTPPADTVAVKAVFDGGLTLEAVLFNPPTAREPTQVEAGETLAIDVYWRADDRLADTSFYVHLVDQAGVVVGQADVSRATAEMGAGRQWVTRHNVPVLPTTPPGRYRLVAGAYRTETSRLVQLRATPVTLDEVEVVGRTEPPITPHPINQTFTAGVTLVGYAWDTTLPEQARLLLHWRRDREGAPLAGRVEIDGQSVDITIPNSSGGRYVITAVDASPNEAVSVIVGNGSVSLSPPTTQRWLDYGGEMALVGVSAARRGQELVVDLDWLALRPLTNDYTVSVKARGVGWSAQSDGTPAGGAVPTLKWVAGKQVRDRHRLTLPANTPGPMSVTVGVYDAFTATPLGVLDDRLLKRGQGEEPIVLTLQ